MVVVHLMVVTMRIQDQVNRYIVFTFVEAPVYQVLQALIFARDKASQGNILAKVRQKSFEVGLTFKFGERVEVIDGTANTDMVFTVFNVIRSKVSIHVIVATFFVLVRVSLPLIFQHSTNGSFQFLLIQI